MNKLNTLFLNAYTNVDEAYKIERYIKDMSECKEDTDKIDNWDEDYFNLNKCMQIYNIIDLRENMLRKAQCTKQDIIWLQKFEKRLIKGTDPLAKYKKRKETLEKINATVEKVKPIAKKVAIGCGIAIVALSLLNNGQKDTADKE